MSQITTEQALQIPQQLKRQGSQGGANAQQAAPASASSNSQGILGDETVTLMQIAPRQTTKRIQVNEFKSALGADNNLVKETLRNKLAEYGLNPNTRVSVKKDLFGNIELKGAILQTDIERITQDLNNSQAFKQAFSRLSQQQPTLNYVDNVVKLTSAYGVGNSLFNSLVSEESEFNQLNDITTRYQALKANQPANGELEENSDFSFTLNG